MSKRILKTVDDAPDMKSNPEEVIINAEPETPDVPDTPSNDADDGNENVTPTNLERDLETVHHDMETCAAEYNAARDLVTVTNLNKRMKDLEDEYVVKRQAGVFGVLLGRDNPILEAVKTREFSTYRHRDNVDKDSGVTSREIVEVMRPVDLAKLCKYSADRNPDRNLTPDRLWVFKVQRFNQLMTARAAVELGLNVKDVYSSYYMNEKAKEIEMGKTPTSNTQLLKALQACLDAILPGYKATSHDVAYLLLMYCKKGKKALSVAAANHGTMRQLVTDMLYHLVTGNNYAVEYKRIEAK